jgi:hypothetical protein
MRWVRCTLVASAIACWSDAAVAAEFAGWRHDATTTPPRHHPRTAVPAMTPMPRFLAQAFGATTADIARLAGRLQPVAR